MTKRHLYIDADTILYSSAAQQQVNKCLATHAASGRDKLFESKTEFNTWIKEQEKWDKDDFTFETISEVEGEPRFAFHSIKQKIENILEAVKPSGFTVIIEGVGNFRKDYDTPYIDYKGHRPPKPLLYSECYDFMCRKYKDNIILAKGVETDDLINRKAWESYNIALKTRDKDKAPYIIAYADKDIVANSRGWFFNYMKPELGIFWVDSWQQQYKYWHMALTGDTADAIPGCKKLSDEFKEKYGIKTRGVGEKTADKLLADCKTEAELAKVVVEAYKSNWGDEWRQCMQDNLYMLHLERYDGDRFNLEDTLEKLGIMCFE